MRHQSLTRLPDICGLGESTATVSKRSHDGKASLPIEVTCIVKVARSAVKDRSGESYWTEILNISAHSGNGAKVFEAFHILAVPESQFDVFEKLRRQLRGSLMSELTSIQGPGQP